MYVVTVLCALAVTQDTHFFSIGGCKDTRGQFSESHHVLSLPWPPAHTHAHTHMLKHSRASTRLCWNEASPVPEQTRFHLEEVFYFYPSKTLSGKEKRKL